GSRRRRARRRASRSWARSSIRASPTTMSRASPSSGCDIRSRHGRACPCHPRLITATTKKDVDARDKRGHDGTKDDLRRETKMELTLRAAALSLFLLGVFVGAWHLATLGSGPAVTMDPEYAKLVGASASQGKSAMPGPAEVGAKVWEHLKNPFYDRGSNDKGLGIQLAYSIARVLTGYLIAVATAIPIGFLIGMSPLMSRALDPFIQVLKPISPLAWMPLALYTIKDSGLSSIFVIFICSLWPMLINTAF